MKANDREGHQLYQRRSRGRKPAACNLRNEIIERKALQLHLFIQLHDQILRHERGHGNIHFSCSADHVQDWQSYPVDPYSCCMCDHTYHYADTSNMPTSYQ